MKRSTKKSLYKIFVSLFVIFYTFLPQSIVIGQVIDEMSSQENAAPIETQESIPQENAAPTEVVPEEKPLWVVDGNTAVTSNPVELDKEYTAPQNDKVKIIFTKLPDNPSSVKIKEITLTEEEIKVSGAVSDKAYDITADMVDGTFEYDLVLPSVKDGIKVVYAEDRDSILTDLKEVDNTIVNEGDSIKIEDLEHFTIFIATYHDADWWEDPHTIEQTQYHRGENVVAYASGLPSDYYRIDIISPSNTPVAYSSTCSSKRTEISYTYKIKDADAIGTGWRVVLSKFSSKDNCNNNTGATDTATDYFEVTSTSAPTPLSNPTLSNSCGLDIALVIDNSNSIDASELGLMKSALKGFVNALAGTPTQFSVTKFGTNATVIRGFTSDTSSVESAIDSVTTGGGGTNWENAFNKARATFDLRTDKPNLIIFASDGNPTYPNCGGSSTCTKDVNAAIIEANHAKETPARILAIGVGNDLSVGNLQAISGDIVNGSDISTTDVITTDFVGMADKLAAFATKTCGGTITINKYIDSIAPANLATDTWTFSTNIPGYSSVQTSGGQVNIPVPSGSGYSITEASVLGGYTFGSASCKKSTGDVVGTLTSEHGVTNITVGNDDIIHCDFVNLQNCHAGQHTLEGKIKSDGYTTGNLCEGNGDCWTEGENVPARLTITGLDTGVPYSVVIEHDYQYSGKTGYENFNTPISGNSTANAISLSEPTIVNCGTNITCKDYTLSFTPTSSTVQLDWNVLLSTTAAQWPGASLHYRLITGACGGAGNKDIPINPSKIVILGSITPIKSNENGANPSSWTFNIAGNTNVNGVASGSTANNLALSTNNGDATYTITEVGPTGWVLDSVSSPCTKTGDKTATVTLTSSVPDVSCTFTNIQQNGHLIVQKTTIPSGDQTEFTTNLLDSTGVLISSGLVTDSTDKDYEVTPGTYSVTETVPTGWSLTSNGCTGISVAAGETKYCTITNTKYGSITIVKDSQPDSSQDFGFTTTGDGLSNFSLDDDTNSTLSNTKTFNNLLPGSYTVTETSEDFVSWALTNLVCTDPTNDSSKDTTNPYKANINLAAGENVTCTYTNTMKGVIGGYKYEDLDGNISTSGDRVNVSGWTIQLWQGDTKIRETVTTETGYSFGGLLPGDYTVKEVSQDGWFELSPLVDGHGVINVSLSAGQHTYTNNFINTRHASVTVFKSVDTDGDGDIDTADARDWFWNKDGSGHYSTGTIMSMLMPGTYTFSEEQKSGFHVTSLICNNGVSGTSNDYGAVESQSIAISSGQNLVCTFTNTRDTGTIELKKVWSGTGGQTNLNIGTTVGGTDVKTVQTGANGGTPLTTGQQTVPTGTYYLSESGGLSDYNSSLSCTDNGQTTIVGTDNSISVEKDHTIICTFTNTRNTGVLKVVKVLTNDNGGTLKKENFSFKINSGEDIFFESDGTNEITLPTGTYTVTENTVNGYTTTYNNCTGVSVTPGGTTTCTITNDDQPATLIVKKVVINDNGGTKTASDFSFNVNSGTAVTFEADGQNNLTVAAGTYNVTELSVAGYSTTYDNCSNLIIANGGTQTCTIVNDDQPGTITIYKDVANYKGIYENVYSDAIFGVYLNEDLSTSKNISDKEIAPDIAIYTDVNAGDYSLDEIVTDGYRFEGCYVIFGETEQLIGDNSFKLNNGQDLEIVCKNIEIQPQLRITKDNDSSIEGLLTGSTVLYTIIVSAPSDEDEKGTYLINNIKVTDILPKGFEYMPGTWTANSSVRGNIKGSITTEPEYNEGLATWILGDMKEGEIVTLTYTAKINLLNEPGTYKDIAFVQGDSLLAEKDSGDVLGISYDPSEYLHTDTLGDNFVGTNVLVVEPIEEGGEVLGASTTLTLPKTGAETYITLGAIISMILGILLFVFGKKRKLNTILLSTVLLFGIFTLVKPVQTYAQVPVAKVSVRLEQPKTGLTDREFNITYVALSIPVKPITVQCQYSLDGVNFSNFDDTLKTTNSGDCKVDQSIVTGSGTYYFKAVATVEGVSPVESEVVSVNITNNPSPVTEYSKTKTACIYTLKFKSSTSKVQIFRSDNQKSFYADDTTLITKPYLTVTPNVLSTYTDTPADCSKEYYYAVRAVDEYSNVSTLVTDNVVTIIEQTQTSTPQESEEVAGEQTTTQQEQETTSTGEVAGEETTSQQEEETKTDTKEETETEEEETKESIWDKYKYLIISLIVVVLGSGIYSYIRRKK